MEVPHECRHPLRIGSVRDTGNDSEPVVDRPQRCDEDHRGCRQDPPDAASVEAGERSTRLGLALLEEDGRDDVTRDHEEHVHPEKTGMEPRDVCVEHHNEQDGQGSKRLDVWPERGRVLKALACRVSGWFLDARLQLDPCPRPRATLPFHPSMRSHFHFESVAQPASEMQEGRAPPHWGSC